MNEQATRTRPWSRGADPDRPPGGATHVRHAAPSERPPASTSTERLPTADRDAAARRPRDGAEPPPPATADVRPVAGAYFAEIPVDHDHAQPRVSRGRSSTRTRWPSWCTRSARSACCSRSSSGAPATDPYELIMGERRWRATQEAGLDDDPRDRPGDRRRRHAARRAAGEPAPLPAEPARGGGRLQQLLEDFGCTHDELAGRIGRSRPQISNTLRLLKLPPAVQRRVAAGVLSAGHARALLAVEDPEAQDRLAAADRRRGHLGARPRGDRRGR